MFVSRACGLLLRSKQLNALRSCLASHNLPPVAPAISESWSTGQEPAGPWSVGFCRGFSIHPGVSTHEALLMGTSPLQTTACRLVTSTPLQPHSKEGEGAGTSPPPGILHKLCPPKLLPYAQLIRLDKPIGVPHPRPPSRCSQTHKLAQPLIKRRHLALGLAMLLVHCPGSSPRVLARPLPAGPVRHRGGAAARCWVHCERSVGPRPGPQGCPHSQQAAGSRHPDPAPGLG